MAVYIKKADFFDINFLKNLRSQDYVLKYSKHDRPVGWLQHIRWIIPIILGLSNKKLYVIKDGGLSIGQMRFDILSLNEQEVSISVLKGLHGKGVAAAAFSASLSELRKDKNIKILRAVINEKNIASIKFFEKLKFELKSKDGSWLNYYFKI
jgi:RimJ/RimL family protein N-acetyltransferase